MPLNTTDSVETFNKDEHKTRRAKRELQVALKNLGGNAKLVGHCPPHVQETRTDVPNPKRFSTFDSNSERVGENSALIKEQERHELENGGKGSPFNAKKWLRAKATMKGRLKLSTPQPFHLGL
ncbi:hypothetical protein TRAPUB_14045 [Trametes pubescens]|uniref:Uncharacterized protein n=1 Tax=Trametes pubescens TaxID=154538 RepID=A0A1M2VPG0_TRAPU|nr:hypothetical protein TRAPUB_14045 [Trametes pubescens]